MRHQHQHYAQFPILESGTSNPESADVIPKDDCPNPVLIMPPPNPATLQVLEPYPLATHLGYGGPYMYNQTQILTRWGRLCLPLVKITPMLVNTERNMTTEATAHVT